MWCISQSDQPMPLVLSQSYSTGAVVRIPTEPHTVGDHIRRECLRLAGASGYRDACVERLRRARARGGVSRMYRVSGPVRSA